MGSAESLCRTPETNITLCVDYSSIKKEAIALTQAAFPLNIRAADLQVGYELSAWYLL